MARTAIVVDDEPIIRLDLSQMLEDLGLVVVASAADGFDAVELCRAHKPDVVLLDLNMPVFDGLSAAETILAEDLAGCVVVVTAFADAAFLERASAVGVTGYLVKPVEQRVLLPAIEVALAQSQRLRQARKAAEEAGSKLAAMRVIDRAKALLAAENNCTEAEAYRQLQKLAMEKRCSMAHIAGAVLEKQDGRELLRRAKSILMEKRGIGEQEAYNLLTRTAKAKGIQLKELARAVIAKGGSL